MVPHLPYYYLHELYITDCNVANSNVMNRMYPLKLVVLSKQHVSKYLKVQLSQNSNNSFDMHRNAEL